jgi:hypothetical protein
MWTKLKCFFRNANPSQTEERSDVISSSVPNELDPTQVNERTNITFSSAPKQPELVHEKAFKGVPHILRQFRVYKEIANGDFLASSKDSENLGASYAGFVGTVICAYSGHHNLIIRPDDIWITVLIQLSFYINKNSEQLRDKFVKFDGEKTIEISELGSLQTANYQEWADKFCNGMIEYLADPSIRDWIVPNFTTTTATDKVVGSIIMMATLKNYFDFKCTIQCGIPNVTLMGTKSDWQAVLDRVRKLHLYDIPESTILKTWQNKLEPICQQFVNCFNDRVDADFWSKICSKERYGSGSTLISGWITNFIVFDEDGKYIHKESIDSTDIPNGIVSVPVTINNNGAECKAMMFAGSIGYTLAATCTIQPSIDWAIALVDPNLKPMTIEKFFGGV